ncbi:ExeA family protein [Brevibacillus agri]|uniref:ExeA family protein n=1 Tax=Brevibacillus agri TaxID=51101 RepID=UPI0002A4EADF|nr:ATPase AAA [Brevibacillus agri BAB-2500]
MLEFFGMVEVPFTRELKPEQCFVSTSHKEATARLEFAIQHRQVGLITGEAGMGKTTLVRSLLRQLETSRYRYEYLCDSSLTPKLFYREILDRFGVQSSSRSTEMKRQYQTLMLDLYEQDRKIPVIVLDEAHRFSETMLQEIRFALNFKEDSMSPLSLILIGQPSLRTQLKVRHMDAIDQRIQMRYQVNGLSEKETGSYIQHQVKISGSPHEIFSEEAIQVVYQFTQGVPRKINTLCSQALLDAYIQGNKIVGESHIHRAINEM